jgi:hypothetical protein
LACTDDSLGGGSSIDPNAAPAVAKIDSISFAASEGSCNEDGVLKKVFVHDDSIHLYMNKDGSAVLKERMGTICPEQGEVSKVSLEKLDDTLLVLINYYEYPPDTVIVYNDSLGKNDTLFVGRPRRKCMCYSDYEIEVPAEFTGAKFIGLKSSFNNNTFLYPIAYKND